MNYGLILCAGKQSRFKSETPKALVEINGSTLLSRNIRAMSSVCDKIYVVCSVEKQKFFTPKKLLSAIRMPILSGKGSGDAVWQALNKLDIQVGDKCFILWGDCLQRRETYLRLNNSYNGTTLIPCKKEEHPYVQIMPNGRGGVTALFSKFNEPISQGYHDLSLFCCNALELKLCLNRFHDKIVDRFGSYIHKHGNEMEFVDVFNETDISANVLEFENYDEFAFNTLEQLMSAISKLDESCAEKVL